MYTALILIKTPYEVAFTGNPMPFIWQVAPYGAREKASDFVVTARVLIEHAYGSDKFEEIYVQKLYPADDGTVRLDVNSIVDPYLTFYTPRPDLQKPVECQAQRKRYQVVTTFDAPGLYPPEWYDLPPVYRAPVYYHAVKGGLSKEAWHPDEFFTKIIAEQKKPLRFTSAREKTDPAALQYLFWMYPLDDSKEQTITYKVYFSDGTSISQAAPAKTEGGKWSIHCTPAGFLQCKLNDLVPLSKSPVRYSIAVATEDGSVMTEYFYTLDPRNFYDAYYLMYRNSIGGLDTLRLTGQVDLDAEYTREISRPAWFPAGTENESTQEEFNYTGITGFIGRDEAMKIRDLYLSRERYQVEDKSFLPVIINNNKARFFSNKEKLIAVKVEWQNAYVNSFFTPAAFMPRVRSCPPIEKLVTQQPTKNTLLFTWSLQQPYDQIEISIIIGMDEYVNRYNGNSGMAYQLFTNPLTGSFVQDITIKARTVCNADADPVEFGPYTNYIFQITGDFPPVAVDDYFQVPMGFTGELEYSALDNDYDPDGEEIEAIPTTGLFGNGDRPGVYQINKRGIITILEAPGNFQGRQGFEYQIINPGPGGMMATAMIWINFGSGPQAVFVKWVFRDLTYGTAQGGQWMSAEAWLDFFSDAACTVPLDLTNKNITVNAKYVATGVATGGKTFSFVAEGMRKLMRSKSSIYLKGSRGFDYEIVFTVLPGTGYVAVNP